MKQTHARLARRAARRLALASALGALTMSMALAQGRPAGNPGAQLGPLLSLARFDMIDADGNGAVTMEELEAFAKARFGRADRDGDGLLARDEVVALVTAGAEARRARAEENGANPAPGPARPMPDAGRIGRIANRLIARFDKNGDGMLSLAELQPPAARMERILERIDRDQDGVISAQEAELARARWAAHRRCAGAGAAPRGASGALPAGN